LTQPNQAVSRFSSNAFPTSCGTIFDASFAMAKNPGQEGRGYFVGAVDKVSGRIENKGARKNGKWIVD
jgi:hypothetical protein